jgi:hypothetical protein
VAVNAVAQTIAPSFAKRSAVARSMPWSAAVIRAIFPSRLAMRFFLFSSERVKFKQIRLKVRYASILRYARDDSFASEECSRESTVGSFEIAAGRGDVHVGVI